MDQGDGAVGGRLHGLRLRKEFGEETKMREVSQSPVLSGIGLFCLAYVSGHTGAAGG